MSATGYGGVTLLAGQTHDELSPVEIPAFSSLTFTHNVGRRAFQVIVTSGNVFDYGRVLTQADIAVSQPSENVLVVANNNEDTRLVFIACRWEHMSYELDLVMSGPENSVQDSRVVIAPFPPV